MLPMADFLALSYLERREDNRPRPVMATWDQLTLQLSSPRTAACTLENCVGAECPHKNGPSWMPASYEMGATRSKLNVQTVSAFVMDLDHLTDAQLIDAAQRFTSFRYVAHASHSDSHRPPRDVGPPGKPKLVDGRCVRVIVALTRPVTRDEWPRFWAIATHMFGGVADPSTCDASRLYYLPSRPQGADFFFASQDGGLLDVDRVLAHAPPETDLRQGTPLATGLGLKVGGDSLQAAALELAAHWPRTGRHQAQLALAGALAREGWDPEQIADFCALVARLEPGRPQGYDGYENGKRHRAAADSVAKLEAGVDIAAWGTLEKILGEEGPRIIASVGRKLGVFDDTFARMMIASSPAAALPQTLTNALGLAATLTPDQIAPLVEELAAIDVPVVRSFGTGMPRLDELLGGGISTQQVVILAAPPGASKTGFVLNLALHVERTAIPALYVSTELDGNEIVARLAGNILDRPWREIVRGKAASKLEVQAALKGRRIRAVTRRSLPRDEGPGGVEKLLTLLAGRVAAMKEQYGEAPVLIVDYLQQLARGSDEGLRTRVGQLVFGLLIIAQHFDCPVIAVTSVSRAYYGQAKQAVFRTARDATVYLAAAKESGDVEYDSGTLMYLDVEKSLSGPQGAPVAIAVAKCRHGETGFVGARAQMASGRWVPDETAADDVLNCDGSAQRVATGLVKRATSMAEADASDAVDDQRLIEHVRANAQPKHVLKQTCGVKGKRFDAAFDRCIAARKLISRKEGTDSFGRISNAYVIDVPDRPVAQNISVTPAIERPAPDPLITAWLSGMDSR